jgi:hypothetical protein
MKQLITLLILSCSLFSLGQSEKKYLHLENLSSGKIKRLNLDHMSYMHLTKDSTDINFDYGYYDEYYSESYEKSTFAKNEITFNFTQTSREVLLPTETGIYYSESIMEVNMDSTIKMSVNASNTNYNIVLTYQTKARRAMYCIGLGIFSASAFGILVASPFLCMNNGTFNGYSWNRFWRSELYSGLGLVLGTTICVSFLERDYYFQSQEGLFETWQVVEN